MMMTTSTCSVSNRVRGRELRFHLTSRLFSGEETEADKEAAAKLAETKKSEAKAKTKKVEGEREDCCLVLMPNQT